MKGIKGCCESERDLFIIICDLWRRYNLYNYIIIQQGQYGEWLCRRTRASVLINKGWM